VRDRLISAVLFLSLGLDTLAVAIGLGLSGLGRRERWRPAASFALAEGIMPLLGFLLGKVLAQLVGEVASFIAALVLLAIGAYTIWEAMHGEDAERQYDTRSPAKLAILALSVSIDELAVGFSLGLFGVPILLAVSYIALQAFIVTLLGIRLGTRLGEALVDQAELASGLVLMGLGVFLLVEKLTGI
jgi:putative Mn2+ efflux pump MntP